MLSPDALREALQQAELGEWWKRLQPLLEERLRDGAHRQLQRWRAAIAALPLMPQPQIRLDSAAITVTDAVDEAGRADSSESQSQQAQIRDILRSLMPWRKGPFDIHGIAIDTEWRCNLKWDRLKNAIAPLAGRRVLDVGCGNGYYGWRMRGAGAAEVVGIDPTLLYVAQFAAIQHFIRDPKVVMLPLRLNELPDCGPDFDSVFSMGVLYHQRSPIDHLRQLRTQLAAGGDLLLETLILPGTEALARTPADRYARMRNVWLLPSLPELQVWLARSGFRTVTTIDVSVTSIDEQRSTDWMQFESLQQALNPQDPSQTVEGWPAPRRALLACRTD